MADKPERTNSYNWVWNQFYNGLSENRLVSTNAKQFQSNSNIDIFSESGFAQLSPIVKDLYTVNGTPRRIINLTEYGGSGLLTVTPSAAYVDAGQNYVFPLANVVDAFVKYDGSSTPVPYIYYLASNGAIHRSDITVTTNTNNYRTSTPFGTLQRAPWVVVSTRAIWGANNQIFSLDANDVLTTRLTLRPNEKVTGLTNFSDQYKIYTATPPNGYQYLWDGVTNTVDYEIRWEGLPIRSAISAGSIDYVVAGFSQFYSDLYMVSGYDRREIAVGKDGGRGKQFFPASAMREDMLMVGGVGGIYLYGNYYAGFPKALSLQYSILGNSNEYITTITSGIATSYVGYSDSSTHRVKTLHHNLGNEVVSDDGEIVSQTFVGRSIGTRKTFDSVSVYYDLSNDGSVNGSVQLYGRQTPQNSWTLIGESDGEEATRFFHVPNAKIPDVLKVVNSLELKIVINKGTASPAVYEVNSQFTDNLRQ